MTTELKLVLRHHSGYKFSRLELLQKHGIGTSLQMVEWCNNFLDLQRFASELNCYPCLISIKTLLTKGHLLSMRLDSKSPGSIKVKNCVALSLPSYEPVYLEIHKPGFILNIETRKQSLFIDKESIQEILPKIKGLTEPLLALVPIDSYSLNTAAEKRIESNVLQE